MCSLSKYKKPCGHRQCWTQTFCRMIVQGKSILLVTKAIILKNSLSSRSRRCGRCIISQKLIILNSLCWPWPFHVRYFSHSPSGGEIFRPLASNFVRCIFLIVRIFLLHCMKGMRNGWSKENSPYLLQLWLENRIMFFKILKNSCFFPWFSGFPLEKQRVPFYKWSFFNKKLSTGPLSAEARVAMPFIVDVASFKVVNRITVVILW